MNDKSKKYVIKGFEDGYEDKNQKMIEEARKRLSDEEKEFNPLDIVTTKNIIIVVVWGLIYKLFVYFEFGLVYFFMTIIALIFYNLGERKPWELSAYSIFNPNCERIPGTFTASSIQPGIERNNLNENNNDNNNQLHDDLDINNRISEERTVYNTKTEIRKRKMKEQAKQPLNSICECGSNKKYKGCCFKNIED